MTLSKKTTREELPCTGTTVPEHTMPPSKQLNISESAKQKKMERHRENQDGDDASTMSDGQSDYETSSAKYSESPVMERSLHKMLQELRAAITADF
ncbi:Hypothetical predicted protein [Pelobates cultripes]|uniref:Uncharacterized protein n=1 Tax=Pelobates cultripes TaxID=61616 RepID=A0AAD1SDA0_PELCU|nr:Hypothetical predicted protein [Pelobates cultripes]